MKFILEASLTAVGHFAGHVGYVMCANKVRSWFYILTISATMSFTLYVILDLEFPRSGLIRVDEADRALTDLRKSMR